MKISTFKHKKVVNKRAFTLIELLIVIAIIGILFIVLVSKVDFATDKAKATGVQTDFRSFQVAFDTVAKENAGFNTFGWDTGDTNGDRIRNSYDKGDTNQNGKQDEGEVFVGSKTYGENWTGVYTLVKPGTSALDADAVFALESAINKNLDPKLHITIGTDGKITMANQAMDPWNTEYHGYYISNAVNDGKDRGAIIIYSNGANQEFGSEHSIANGVVTVTVPGNNVYGKDDYSIVSCYTYMNGYGEVLNITTGFSNNQGFFNSPSSISGETTNQPDVLKTYEMLSGNNIIITLGRDLTALFKSEADYELFVGVKINGVEISDTYYDVRNGSTIVELNESYIQTLTVGTYNIEIVSSDGSASAVFHVEEPAVQTIPEGATYTKADGTVLNAGDPFPETVTTGDAYQDGNYLYKYNQYYYISWQIGWTTDNAQNGWGVKCTNNTASPGAILNYVNGKPVTNMSFTFSGCSFVTVVPEIPNTVTNMERAFANSNITTAPAIPSSVVKLSYAFYSCTSLLSTPDMSNAIGVVKMDYAFQGCTALSTISSLPPNVTDISYAFSGCSALVIASEIPNYVTNMNSAFASCTNLTQAPTIPSSVVTMRSTFSGCSGLQVAPDLSNASNVTDMTETFKNTSIKTYAGSTDADGDFSKYILPANLINMSDTFRGCKMMVLPPVIPSSVTKMSYTFEYCTSLEVAPVIPSGVTSLRWTFTQCSALRTYVGSTDADGDFSGYLIPSVVEDMNSTFYGCKSITTAPVIPESVTSLYQAFYNCTALTGTITINASPSSYTDCLKYTSISSINGTSTNKDAILATK